MLYYGHSIVYQLEPLQDIQACHVTYRPKNFLHVFAAGGTIRNPDFEYTFVIGANHQFMEEI